MDASEDRGTHRVKRVVLPSGKTIEVVYFKDPTESEPEQDLHFCVSCRSNLVYPTSWDEAGQDSWRVALRCPECESVREGVFSQATVDAFDEELETGTDALAADLRSLCRANMAEEIERFSAALEAGAILPEDFRVS